MGKRKTVLVLLLFFSVTLSAIVVPSVSAVEDSWVTMEPMPTARSGLGVAVVDGKIYAIGGSNNGKLDTNEMYDPETDTWTTKALMPTPRDDFAIALLQNKIYVIGGKTQTNYTYTGANEVYDPLTDTWETRTPIPTPRENLDANVVDNKIYLIGGSRTNLPGYALQSFNLNEVYDPYTDTWSTGTPLPTAVYSYTSAVVDNKIYVIGGSGGTSNQIYTPEKDSWNTGASIPFSSFAGAGAATTGNYAPKMIYNIGGGSIIPSSGNQIYDPVTDTWTTGAVMPTARNYLAVAVVDDVLYAIGGVNGALGGYFGTNEKYTPVGYGTVSPPPDTTCPKINTNSPRNTTYTTNSINLTFEVDEETSWMGYSLDGKDNVTLTENTLNLTELANGAHNLIVYATDTSGNTGTSEPISFTINKEPEQDTTSTLIVAIAVMVVAAIAAVIVYTKKKQT